MRKRAIQISIVLILVLIAAGAALVSASPLALVMNRLVIAGGGGHSSFATYELDYTIGQPVAGLVVAGHHFLCAGYWCGVGGHTVYLPLILRSS